MSFVGEPLGGELGDLKLLGRRLVGGREVAPAARLAGCAELSAALVAGRSTSDDHPRSTGRAARGPAAVHDRGAAHQPASHDVPGPRARRPTVPGISPTHEDKRSPWGHTHYATSFSYTEDSSTAPAGGCR